MSQKSLFDYMKGLLGSGGSQIQAPMPRQRPGVRYEPPPTRPVDPDGQNPGTILRIGKSNDGRELIMTLGLGTFLVDREAPSICYYQQGAVAAVPTLELRHLCDCLLDKRNTGDFAAPYVDLLNVAAHELETRTGRGGRAAGVKPMAQPTPQPPPFKPMRPVLMPRWPDAENPATITRVGRSNNGGELIMTLGLGTFVLHREAPDLKYFDRGREWDIQDQDLRLLSDALMAKTDPKEHPYTYVDLLNVCMHLIERRKTRR